MEKLSIKIMINKFIQVFLVVFFFNLLMVVNSSTFVFENFNNDIIRFLKIKNLSIDYLLYVLLLSTFVSIIIYQSKKSYQNKHFLVKLFIYSSFSHLLFLYIFEIYIYRPYLLLALLLIPLSLYLLDSLNKKNKIYYLLVFFLAFSYYFINHIDIQQKAKDCDENPFYFISTNCKESSLIELEYGKQFDEQKYLDTLNTKSITYNINETFLLDKYSICCDEYSLRILGKSSAGYVDTYKNNLFFLNGSGFILYINEDSLESNSFKFSNIKSNLDTVIRNKLIKEAEYYNFGWESIKDLLIVQDNMYISLIEEKSSNCVNIQVLMGKINFDYIEFNKIFEPKECINRTSKNYEPLSSGGKMESLNNREIILTIGDFLQYEKPQDLNSVFGKIVKINVLNKNYEIISYGHRNPQGIYFNKDNQILLETEHGPKGGDEVNFVDINRIENFGWPVSSYGQHYNGKFLKEAPLYDSHSEYGFKEPVYYFEYEVTGTHGISSIEKFFDNKYIIGSLNGRLFHTLDFDYKSNQVIEMKTYKINERIRDFKYNPDRKVLYIVLEDSPSIGVLYKKSNP